MPISPNACQLVKTSQFLHSQYIFKDSTEMESTRQEETQHINHFISDDCCKCSSYASFTAVLCTVLGSPTSSQSCLLLQRTKLNCDNLLEISKDYKLTSYESQFNCNLLQLVMFHWPNSTCCQMAGFHSDCHNGSHVL